MIIIKFIDGTKEEFPNADYNYDDFTMSWVIDDETHTMIIPDKNIMYIARRKE